MSNRTVTTDRPLQVAVVILLVGLGIGIGANWQLAISGPAAPTCIVSQP